jgi:hypothetical protein
VVPAAGPLVTLQLHEEHPGLLPAWYGFRDARATRRAVQWLTDNSRFITLEPEERVVSTTRGTSL